MPRTAGEEVYIYSSLSVAAINGTVQLLKRKKITGAVANTEAEAVGRWVVPCSNGSLTHLVVVVRDAQGLGNCKRGWGGGVKDSVFLVEYSHVIGIYNRIPRIGTSA